MMMSRRYKKKSLKSRLVSKQRLSREKKRTTRKSGSHNRSRQHVIPCLLVGWFWSNRILSGGLLTTGQSASQCKTRPVFLILVTCARGCGICSKKPRQAAVIRQKKTHVISFSHMRSESLFVPFELFSKKKKSWDIALVAQQRGNWGVPADTEGRRRCLTHRGSGAARRLVSAAAV